MDKYRRFVTALMWTVITFFMFLLVAGVSCLTLTECTSVKYVPVEIVRIERDTIVKRDTVRRSVHSERKEKEVIKDSTHVIEDENGNVKSKERIRDRILIIENRDSVDYYRHVADSLMSVKADSVEVPYPVEKPLSKWEQIKLDFGGMVIGGIGIFALSAVVIWLIRKKRNNI